jgi:hypothetical protein
VLGILAPVIAAAAGALAVQTRDLYNRRSQIGRRKDAMEDATRQVTFAAEWWKAKQALGSASDDRAARAIVESWLEEATSRVSEALHPPRRAKPKPDLPKRDLSVTRRMLLAYPFQSRRARLVSLAYYSFLAFTVFGVISSPLELLLSFQQNVSVGQALGQALLLIFVAVIMYGLPAFAFRALAVWIEKRKQQTSAKPFVPTDGLTAPQPGWYADPCEVPGQRYWDGKQWTGLRPTQPNGNVQHPPKVGGGAEI